MYTLYLVKHIYGIIGDRIVVQKLLYRDVCYMPCVYGKKWFSSRFPRNERS